MKTRPHGGKPGGRLNRKRNEPAITILDKKIGSRNPSLRRAASPTITQIDPQILQSAPRPPDVLLPAAIAHARAGFHIFPCWAALRTRGCLCGGGNGCAPGKHPIARLARHGLNDATCDLDTVRRWWTLFSCSNIGISCGASNLVVVDIDPRNGGDRTWADLVKRHGRAIERTWRVRTGSGGTHFYYAAPSRIALRSGSHALGQGVDMKAHGGFVIAPPSLHVSGTFYRYESGVLAPFPAALLRLVRALEKTRRRDGGGKPIVVESDPEEVAATRSFLERTVEDLRWRTADRATALCPAHEDQRASLSIRVLADGDTLFHCFAGCEFAAIMTALKERL